MGNPKKYGDSPLDRLAESIVLIQVNQNLSEINEDRVTKAKALLVKTHYMTHYERSLYMSRRHVPDDWRETFKQMGYEPCSD